MHKSSLAVVLVCSLVLPPLSLAQQSPPQTKKAETRPVTEKPTDQAGEKDAASQGAKLQQRGIDLIKEAGEEAAKLDDRRSAARIQAAAGNALWPYDKEVAQKLFRSAFEAALTYYREGRNEVLDPVTRLTGGLRAELCQEIIRRISSRDAALGRELTEAFNEEKLRGQSQGDQQNKSSLSDKSSLGKGGSGSADLNGPVLEAVRLLRTNQPAAIALAQRIFSQGIPKQALDFVWELAARDRAAADQLFLYMLANIRDDENTDTTPLQILAAYPFTEDYRGINNGHSYGYGAGIYRPEVVARGRDRASEELLVQWFIEVSFIAISRVAASDLASLPDGTSRRGAAAYLAQWLALQAARFRPELLPELQSLIIQLSSSLLPWQQTMIASALKAEQASDFVAYKEQTRPDEGEKRIQQLLEKAEKTPQPAQRDYLYQEAALEADRIGNQTWALKIADQISDPDFRQQVRDWIYFNAATRALSKNELEEARSNALQVKAPDQCAYLFCVMARAALKEKDKSRAAEFLTEAEQQADKADNSPAKVRALMSIANLLVGFDPSHAFETMSSAVRTANRVPSYSPEPGRMVRTLGNATGQRHALIQNAESVELGTGMATLAAVDFDGTLALAQSLENKPLKFIGMIAVAASVLKQQPEIQPPPKKAKH